MNFYDMSYKFLYYYRKVIYKLNFPKQKKESNKWDLSLYFLSLCVYLEKKIFSLVITFKNT